ncbi:MAG: S1C family serine protease, partial [Planctomycetota bacterium]
MMKRLGAASLLVLIVSVSIEAQSLKGVRKEFAEVGERLLPATVIVRGSGAAKHLTGSSGVIVHEDGYVLSDADATLIKVETDEEGKTKRDEKGNAIKIHGVNATVRLPAPDHRVFRAVQVHRDPETDTTPLKITDKIKGELPVVPIGSSDRLRVGSFVLVAGTVFGHKESEPSLSLGIVSALIGRKEPGAGRFETVYTSATVVRGSNGGPMIDKEGRLVGIISTFVQEPTSAYRALGMVTPIDKIRPRYRGVEGYEKIFPDPKTITRRSRDAGILEEAFSIVARRARASIVSIVVEREEGVEAKKTIKVPTPRADGRGYEMKDTKIDRYAGPFTGLVLSRDGFIATCTENLWKR